MKVYRDLLPALEPFQYVSFLRAGRGSVFLDGCAFRRLFILSQQQTLLTDDQVACMLDRHTGWGGAITQEFKISRALLDVSWLIGLTESRYI